MLQNKRLYYFTGITAIILVLVLCAFVIKSADNKTFERARREIMLRNAGHKLLLQSGDSTSRLLPVKQIAENEYQLQFEKQFTFKTDSLVAIIKEALNDERQSNDYVVNVTGCSTPDVLFGYAMLGSEKSSIKPCSGRKQPVGCYRINIIFKKNPPAISNPGYLMAGLPLLAFIGLLLFRPKRKIETPTITITETQTNNCIAFGNMLLDSKERCLLYNGKSIPLTSKECKLLLIFAQSPNQVIARERLQKQIWEDEGVIVGRSLDMFISRLRKKMADDQSVTLVNIHGKGFKLETVLS